MPVGYGYRSVEYIIRRCMDVASLPSLEERQRKLREFDEAGILATPANSRYNELVMEAGRMSILDGGREVAIGYGAEQGVRFTGCKMAERDD